MFSNLLIILLLFIIIFLLIYFHDSIIKHMDKLYKTDTSTYADVSLDNQYDDDSDSD